MNIILSIILFQNLHRKERHILRNHFLCLFLWTFIPSVVKRNHWTDHFSYFTLFSFKRNDFKSVARYVSQCKLHYPYLQDVAGHLQNTFKLSALLTLSYLNFLCLHCINLSISILSNKLCQSQVIPLLQLHCIKTSLLSLFWRYSRLITFASVSINALNTQFSRSFSTIMILTWTCSRKL